MSKIHKSFDESVKRYAVSQLETGKYSVADVAREVGATKSAVWKWSQYYGRYREKPEVLEVVMSSEKEEIERLKSALADSHMKNLLYEEILNQAGKHYKVDLKKTFGTSQSEFSNEVASQSGNSVKPQE
ncbi:MAG: transposase [Bdellovibrionales bacterium]|nr:transposase [Bdellovibrionales bacterium]